MAKVLWKTERFTSKFHRNFLFYMGGAYVCVYACMWVHYACEGCLGRFRAFFAFSKFSISLYGVTLEKILRLAKFFAPRTQWDLGGIWCISKSYVNILVEFEFSKKYDFFSKKIFFFKKSTFFFENRTFYDLRFSYFGRFGGEKTQNSILCGKGIELKIFSKSENRFFGSQKNFQKFENFFFQISILAFWFLLKWP